MASKTYDELKIMEQRIAERKEIERERARQIWPTPCPTCFADVGERCFTINGKKALRHKDREKAR